MSGSTIPLTGLSSLQFALLLTAEESAMIRQEAAAVVLEAIAAGWP